MADATDDTFDFDAFENEIQTWAEGVDHQARATFASQCAARVFPNILGFPRPKEYTGFSFDVTLLRAILTSAVAGTRPTTDVKDADSASSAASSAALSATSSASSTAYSATSSASSATDSAADSAAFSAFSAADSASSASSAASSARSAASSALSAAKLLSTARPDTLFEQPLWMGEAWPDEIAANWTTLRSDWARDPAMAFWIEWYEGLLKGRRPDWDLWYEIVLIDEEHWAAGPEAVAEQIKDIQEWLKEERANRFEDHIRTLTPRFSVLAPQADRLAELIETALNEFQREVSNKIPNSIEPLCKLPPLLRQIAHQMNKGQSDAEIARISELVFAMSETITDLNTRLERANRLPADERSVEQSRLGRFLSYNGMSGWMIAGVTGLYSLLAGPAGDASVQQTLNLTVEQICITDLPENELPLPDPIEEPEVLEETKPFQSIET